MKCPHCGMNVRDNTVVCGYCGEKIAQPSEKAPAGGSTPQKGAAHAPPKAAKPPRAEEEVPGDEEEEEGLSRILQPGEQVRVASLNVSVKKFFFHAYLTNRRIFLIDTQEKKLRVTARDIPLETIADSVVEFSETSDPVLVLSLRSIDDEIKTMKLVFVQNGIDRSSETDDWIALLHEDRQPAKKAKKHREEAAPPEPEPLPGPEPEAEPAIIEILPDEEPPARPAKSSRTAVVHELHPTRRPVKDHEKQPPVKKLLSVYKEPEAEPEPAAEKPVRRTQVRMVEEPAKKSPVSTPVIREIPSTPKVTVTPSRKPEVQSAMKVAMKSAMQQSRQPLSQPAKRPVREPERRFEETERESGEPVPARHGRTERASEEAAETPQYCQNCGKKIPGSANFCPGCGTRLGQQKAAAPATEPRPAPVREKKAVRQEFIDEDEEEVVEKPPAKPPVKRVPKGSDMTILHKFLRR